MYSVQYVREDDRERNPTLGNPQFLTFVQAERLAARRSEHNKYTYLVVDKNTGTIVSQWRHGQRFTKNKNKSTTPAE